MSFRLKTILGIALIEGLLLLLLVIMSMNMFHDTLNEELIKRGRSTAQIFAAIAQDQVISSDLASLESFGDAVMDTPGMVYIRVLDDQNDVLMEKAVDGFQPRAFQEDTSLDAAESDGIYDTFSPIAVDGEVFGRVELGLDTLNLNQILTDSRNKSTTIAIIEMLLVALFSFALGTFLTRQILILKEGVKRLEKGELGYAVEVVGKDEIGQLASSFNSLSTKLKVAYLEQDRQSQYLNDIIDNIYDGLMIINAGGIIQQVNPAVIRIFGYEESDLVGETVEFMMPAGAHKDNHRQYQKDALKDSYDISQLVERKQDLTIIKNDGSPVTVAISISRMRDSHDEQHFVAMISDVTKRKEAAAAMESALEKEKELNNLKTEFLAKVSHELRTPMNGVLGMLHLLEKTSLKKDQLRFVGAAKGSGELMVSIVNDILDFFKLDADKIVLENIPYDPAKLSEEIVTLLADDAFSKGLNIYCEPSLDLPGIVYCDPLRIKQILMNLIGNAIKFTDEGSIFLKINWDEGDLVFDVIDTGVGMDQKQQLKVFEPFVQADNATTRNFGGTGLGLTITSELVSRMQGTLEVSSEPNVGTKFTCRLPLKAEFDSAGRFVLSDDWSNQHILLISADERLFDHVCNILPQNISNTIMKSTSLKEGLAIAGSWDVKTSAPHNLMILDLDELQDGNSLVSDFDRFHDDFNLQILLLSKENRSDFNENSMVVLNKPVCASVFFDTLVSLRGGEDPDQMTAVDNLSKNSNWWFGGHKALLVDDNKINQDIGLELLKSVGFEVDVCENGLEAVKAVQDNHYDAVLMDVQMPVMDGLQATREIRGLGGNYKSLPIIAITANAFEDDKLASKEAGIDRHIEKPFDPEVLYQTLALWVPHEHGSLTHIESVKNDADEVSHSMPNIDGINVEEGLGLLLGNVDFYRGILRDFRQSQANVAIEVEEHLNMGRTEEATALLHALKGVSGSISAQAVCDAATTLERHCRDGEIAKAKENLGALHKSLEEVITGLAILDEE